jgi:uncharacterized protein
MKKENEKNCDGCAGMCCKYVAIEIDAPEDLNDFENIKWYVCHKNINVFISEDNEWFVEFLTPCKFLNENGFCNNYDNRPLICREYSQENCLFYNKDYSEKYTFKKIEDVEEYIKEVFNKNKFKKNK